MKVKCQHCEEYDEKEFMVYKEVGKTKKTKKYYHPKCLEIAEKEAEEYQKLVAYICELFNIKAPTGYILKQIQTFHDKYHYRYYAIQLALEYFFVVQDKAIGDNLTIGIVPYVMEDAKEFYTNLAKLQKLDDLKEAEQKTVTIKSPQKKVDRKKKLINMDDI